MYFCMARFILLKIGYACLKNVFLYYVLYSYMNLYDAQNNRLCMLKNVMLVGFIRRSVQFLCGEINWCAQAVPLSMQY